MLPTLVFSQGWIKTCGYGEGLSLQETIDKGFIISGCTLHNNYPDDVYIIKTDINGDTLWTRTYGESAEECGHSIQQTTDSGYIIAGFSSFYGPGNDTYLIKTDVYGDTLWTKIYHSDRNNYGVSCVQTIDSGYIICGSKVNFNTSGDVYIIKTDINGDTLWTKNLGGIHNDFGFSIQQTRDTGYIITGFYGNTVTEHSLYLIKTNENGDSIWTKTFGEANSDCGYSVQETFDGGYIVTGGTYSSEDNDVYLIKVNQNGDSIWTKKFDGNYHAVGRSVCQTIDSGYIIAGSTGSTSNGHKVYLIKTDKHGNELWSEKYGENFNNSGNSVIETSDGMYVIAGTTFPVNNSTYVLLIKVDSDGNLVSTFEIPIPSEKGKLVKLFDMTGKVITSPQKNVPYIELYSDGKVKKKMIIK